MLSVVIPTWNGRELLEGCLASLDRQTRRDFEVIVVDGGSVDGTVEWLLEARPDVRLIALDRNRGFAAAVNHGIRAARGEIIVLLNNDTEAEPDWLSALLAALERDPTAGIIASRILQYNDRSRIDSAGDKLGLLADQIGHGQPDGPEYRRPGYVISACAAAAAYRREVFNEVGLFDERFESYLEDVDLGVRATYAGLRTLYAPDAVVYHIGSATASRMNEKKIALLARNSLFLFFQYMPLRVIVRWGAGMLAWVFIYAVRSGASVTVGARAVAGVLRHSAAVLRRRRGVRSGRRITDDELLSMIAPPVGSFDRPRPIAAPGER